MTDVKAEVVRLLREGHAPYAPKLNDSAANWLADRVLELTRPQPSPKVDGPWQPIETAPDENVLLLGWWANVCGRCSWECEVEYYARDNGEYSATHWMPLPAPLVQP